MGTNVPPSTSTDADPSSHYAKQRTLTDFLMSNAPRKRKPVDGQQKDGDVVDLVELSSSSDSESNERVICEEITGNCATDDSKVDVNLVHGIPLFTNYIQYVLIMVQLLSMLLPGNEVTGERDTYPPIFKRLINFEKIELYLF